MSGHYDLMASEARLTSYVAISRGDVPRKHWMRLSRALTDCDGYRGMISWTGTMFEYLMPTFLLLFTTTVCYTKAQNSVSTHSDGAFAGVQFHGGFLRVRTALSITR